MEHEVISMTNVTLIEPILIQQYKPHVVTLSDKQTIPSMCTAL